MAATSLSHRKPTCQSTTQRQPAMVWWLLWESVRICWIIEKLPALCTGMLTLLTVIICGEAVNNAHSFTQQPTTSNNCGDLFPRWNAKWALNQLNSFCLWLELYCRGGDCIFLLYSEIFLNSFAFRCRFPKLPKNRYEVNLHESPSDFAMSEPVWKIRPISGACQWLNP